MARIRTIKPDFVQSQSIARVSREARLLFILLWTVADDEGRLRGHPRLLSSSLYPFDDDAHALMPRWLDELEAVGCIVRYSCNVSGTDYIAIPAWRTHQRIDRPSKSLLPPPPAISRSDNSAKPREPSRILDTERKGKEGKGKESAELEKQEAENPQSSAAYRSPPELVLLPIPTPPPSEPVARIPLIDGSSYTVEKAQVAEWANAYPAVAIVTELHRMTAWVEANPKNRKTRRGVLRFIVSWLSRAQDRAPVRFPAVSTASAPGNTSSLLEQAKAVRRAL